jgi:hypothetical protein
MRLIRALDAPEVVTIDTGSAPRIIHHGEDFLLEDLPVGTRVIYPKQPIAGLPNPRAAIRWALHHPLGCDPLPAQLRPGMKVTIAIDDISLPLPQMQRPDLRQTMLEILLEMLADHGVDDVHIIIAIALHRKMTAAEVERAVGPKVFRTHWPDTLYHHDAEDPEGMVELGTTCHGEPVRINRRAAESDLLIYANINFVPMNGGHKSVGVGLTDYEGLKAHHNPQAIRASWSYMDPEGPSELHRSFNRIGKLAEEHLNVFKIETAVNNRMYGGPMNFLAKNEDDFTEADRLKFQALQWTLSRTPRALRREVFMRVPAPYELIAVHAGKTGPVHEKILEKSFEQYAVQVQGQADILIHGVPFISPYNVNSTSLNPLLVQVMGLGYLFNLYRGKPLIRKGGVLILAHPCTDAFDTDHHPSYVEFFHRVLTETRDATVHQQKYEEEFAKNPAYIEMYRRGHAFHGVHPLYMWYWGENGRQHVGKVIVVGADNTHVPKFLGWERAATLAEAIALARTEVGRSAEITMVHNAPVVLADVE